jgi:3D domain protein
MNQVDSLRKDIEDLQQQNVELEEKYQEELNHRKSLDKEIEMMYNKETEGDVAYVVDGETHLMELTFYTTAPDEGGGTGITASGTVATVGRTVACNSLPFGTRVIVEGREYVVEDTGNIGSNTLDILVETKEEAFSKGRYMAEVMVLK